MLLFRILAALPLWLVHAQGATFARIAFALSKRERTRLAENMRVAGYDDAGLRRRAIGEAGKTLFELPWLWLRPRQAVLSRVREVSGLEHAERAEALGRGIIFLTPHHGCFEVAAQYAASHRPITVMYRTPRQRALRPLAEAGRMRDNIRAVPATTSGATRLVAALRKGEWVGILPDQVPSRGDGVWARFFGKWALTMTLPLKLHRRTGAPIIFASCRRLPRGSGYAIAMERFEPAESDEVAAQQMNDAIERLVRRAPEQYLWSYDRYKAPLGMQPPGGDAP
jgi:KDO2-lipid IV(A) lauroyltransferase